MIRILDREHTIFTVRDVLSPAECQAYVDLTEAAGYGDAPITTAAGFVHMPEVRNNARVILDDVQRAAELWERVREHVPPFLDGWQAIGLNERFRFYRYDVDQYFRWHFDGCFARSHDERSMLTLMVYLNQDLLGGSTDFDLFDAQYSVQPETGMALVFEHGVRHQGAPILDGRKYVLRTDVMYHR